MVDTNKIWVGRQKYIIISKQKVKDGMSYIHITQSISTFSYLMAIFDDFHEDKLPIFSQNLGGGYITRAYDKGSLQNGANGGWFINFKKLADGPRQFWLRNKYLTTKTSLITLSHGTYVATVNLHLLYLKKYADFVAEKINSHHQNFNVDLHWIGVICSFLGQL
ncbi:hypothetical protein ACJX0J_025582, partial [Zea mays]